MEKCFRNIWLFKNARYKPSCHTIKTTSSNNVASRVFFFPLIFILMALSIHVILCRSHDLSLPQFSQLWHEIYGTHSCHRRAVRLQALWSSLASQKRRATTTANVNSSWCSWKDAQHKVSRTGVSGSQRINLIPLKYPEELCKGL